MTVPVSTIDELAATVRAGLDADLRIAVAARQQDGREWELHINERGDGTIMHEDNILAWVDTDPTVDDLMRGVLHRDVAEHVVRHDPERVFAEIRAKRQLVDALLAGEHGAADSGVRFRPCAALADLADPCDCGRDARVAGYLRLLAQAWQETT